LPRGLRFRFQASSLSAKLSALFYQVGKQHIHGLLQMSPIRRSPSERNALEVGRACSTQFAAMGVFQSSPHLPEFKRYMDKPKALINFGFSVPEFCSICGA
jgi:hypothetical protein